MPKKKSRYTRPTTASPADFAANIVSSYLDSGELYSEVVDVISGEDFRRLDDAVIARWAKGWPKDRSADQDERQIARQEVCFMLGLEIGKRIGGAR